jgi:hypothetical protein
LPREIDAAERAASVWPFLRADLKSFIAATDGGTAA